MKDMTSMIDDLDDDTDFLMKDEELGKIKNCQFKVSDLFYKFLEFYLEKKISIRSDSLIINLIEYRSTNYK